MTIEAINMNKDEMPNYSEYSLGTLKDVLKHIDKENYPDRVKIINEEIKKREADLLKKENNTDRKTLSEEKRKHELIPLVSISSITFMLSVYSVSIAKLVFDMIPLFITLILCLLSLIYLIKKNIIGVEFLKYSQFPF